MRLSRLFGTRLKEAPADAAPPGHALLLRGGYLRFIGPEIALLPPGERVARRIEAILRAALERLGGQAIRHKVGRGFDPTCRLEENSAS